jgi:hypothetical protein
MDCIATDFTGLTDCRQGVQGVFQLYVALWTPDFKENLDIEGDFISGETKRLAWEGLPVNNITAFDNKIVTDGKFIDKLAFEVAGFYVEDRGVKAWLNYNRLVFVFVGGNGQSFISGEENGHKRTAFNDSTNGSSSLWEFKANTTYINYGITSEYLDKIKEVSDCSVYTDLLAINNTTTIQEQINCLAGDYDEFIP